MKFESMNVTIRMIANEHEYFPVCDDDAEDVFIHFDTNTNQKLFTMLYKVALTIKSMHVHSNES